MSLRLRVKYQFRTLTGYFFGLRPLAFLNTTTARLAIFGLVVATGAAYVWQVSALSSSGYLVQQLEAGLTRLKTENQKLATELAEAQSLASLRARLTALNMVPAENVARLKPSRGSAVAER